MELSIVSYRNVPDGSILSLRSGHIRRQAPFSSSRPFRFPDTATSMKVDVYEPLAAGSVIMQHSALSAKEVHKVIFSDEVSMSCELNIQKLPETVPSPSTGLVPHPPASNKIALMPAPPSYPPAGRPRPDLATRLQAVGAAQEYITKHDILNFMQSVLQTIIREKPADPFLVMSNIFKSQSYDGGPNLAVAQEPVRHQSLILEEAETEVSMEVVADAQGCSDQQVSKEDSCSPEDAPVAAWTSANETAAAQPPVSLTEEETDKERNKMDDTAQTGYPSETSAKHITICDDLAEKIEPERENLQTHKNVQKAGETDAAMKDEAFSPTSIPSSDCMLLAEEMLTTFLAGDNLQNYVSSLMKGGHRKDSKEQPLPMQEVAKGQESLQEPRKEEFVETFQGGIASDCLPDYVQAMAYQSEDESYRVFKAKVCSQLDEACENQGTLQKIMAEALELVDS